MALRKKRPNIGTLVFYKNPDEPLYGVVVEENFWRIEAEKENFEIAKKYLDSPNRSNVIPIFILGNTMSYRFKEFEKDDDDSLKSTCLQKFTYFNSGEDICVIPGGIGELFRTIEQMIEICKKGAGYPISAKEDLKYLRGYLTGNYEGLNMSQYINRWLGFYEKALPGLSGTKKKS